jgi:hypothetical protein
VLGRFVTLEENFLSKEDTRVIKISVEINLKEGFLSNI